MKRYNDWDSAIVKGIKTVGVGKKGSQALPEEIAQEILADLKNKQVTPAACGAFFAGLVAKGVEPSEQILSQAFEPGVFGDHQKLVGAIAPDASDFVQWVCVKLLAGSTLDKQTAYDLGKFLFSSQPGDGARGLVASLLRVRYETDDEYEGLLKAITETISEPFKRSVPEGKPIVQIAEPFDGMDHSYLITPILGKLIQDQGYRVIQMIGRNSGPKLVMNLWDVAQSMGIEAARSNDDLSHEAPLTGWYYHQSLISDALDRWVNIRRQTIKRPFLSTLERFVNPARADILIASAFHPPYGEKMLTIAERAGFKKIIIVRNGIEGSIAFPLKRPVKILVSKLQQDNSFLRHEINIDVEELLVQKLEAEEMIDSPRASDNARLIQSYLVNGKSGNQHIDLRVKVTMEGLTKALQWF